MPTSYPMRRWLRPGFRDNAPGDYATFNSNHTPDGTKPDVEAHMLFGWWKILSFQVEFEDAGERADTYGVNPLGHMVIERDRMMSILTSRERPNNDPTALFETMIAYSGSCHVEDGDKLIIKVDTAWHPAWIGTEQVRFFKVDSGVLSITTAWQTHPLFPGRMARGVLTAQRICREYNV